MTTQAQDATTDFTHLLAGRTVAILAMDGFEQVELTEPKAALEEAGVTTQIISARAGEIQGMNQDRTGDRFRVDLTLDKADPRAFDAVLLPGGDKNGAALRANDAARSFVKTMNDDGKPIAAICHAPWLLASAELVRGRRITSHADCEADLKAAGAIWVDEAAVVDGNFVTSRVPEDIPAFNDAFKRLLAGRVQESVAGTSDDMLVSGATGG